MSAEFRVEGANPAAPFDLTLHRGDGMTLVAMNWKQGKPPNSFVGFAIEYKEPNGDRFYALKNRLSFPGVSSAPDKSHLSTFVSPIQKFRWVHFPRNAELAGPFTYRVKPVFMDGQEQLSYGDAQSAEIELRRETYPNQLNVTFTRGFVSSQAFVEKYESAGPISTLIPAHAKDGLKFSAAHPKKDDALRWMGFEARSAILEVLDQALDDPACTVRVVAYDLNEPEIVSRLEKLGPRLRVIIDDDGAHGKTESAENEAERALAATAGANHVKRQHMGQLQHNKTIVVDGPNVKTVVCGSTNFSWRGLYVQNNNAVIMRGESAVRPFAAAFEAYWDPGTPSAFGETAAARWTELGLAGIDAKVAFSPHSAANAVLKDVADDIGDGTTSCLFYSLAFLYQTPGEIRDAIQKVTNRDDLFVYGISDRNVGIQLQKPDRSRPVYPTALTNATVPEPFKAEPTGSGGVRLHHKFLVIDFDKPTARVYLGSYNFSKTADTLNGENLLLIRDRRIATSYAIEALRIFDHYHFRVAQVDSEHAHKKLELRKPPHAGEKPWFDRDYTDPVRIRDREVFA